MSDEGSVGIEQKPQNYGRMISDSVQYLTISEVRLENYLELRRGGAFQDIYVDFIYNFRIVYKLVHPLKSVKENSDYTPMLNEIFTYLKPNFNESLWSKHSEKDRLNHAIYGLKLSGQFRDFLGNHGLISLD